MIFRDRYDVICAACGYIMEASPSIFMTHFGLNSGTAYCPKCETLLHLEIVPDLNGTEMKSEISKDFTARKRREYDT